jgi:cytochrome b6-f complex iron-sulfur subunit
VVTACGSDIPGAEGGPAAAGTVLAKETDVAAGSSLVVSAGDQKIALARTDAGEIVAHTAVCTHMRCTVAAAGAELACPCHNSRFNAATGEVVKGPAAQPLSAISVTVSNGSILLA